MRMIKAIFRAIGWAIKSFFKLIIKIINKLKLWLLIAYLLACGIIQLITGVFSNGYMIVFWAGLVIAVLITLFIILVSASNSHNKKAKAAASEQKNKRKKEKESYPKFFTVEGNNDFFMAEYKDRFELYHMEGDGKLTYVRTDKKTDKKEDDK